MSKKVSEFALGFSGGFLVTQRRKGGNGIQFTWNVVSGVHQLGPRRMSWEANKFYLT